MNTIRFIFQALFATVITWTMASFVLWEAKPWAYNDSQRLGSMIVLIIMFIIVKSFTDPD